MNKIRIADILVYLMIISGLILILIAFYFEVMSFTNDYDNEIPTTKTFESWIGSSLDAFQIDVGRYPSTNEGLSALVQRPDGVTKEQWRGPYSRSIPKDGWKREFLYFCPPKDHDLQTSFQLISLGRDGKMGTEDDITNP